MGGPFLLLNKDSMGGRDAWEQARSYLYLHLYNRTGV